MEEHENWGPEAVPFPYSSQSLKFNRISSLFPEVEYQLNELEPVPKDGNLVEDFHRETVYYSETHSFFESDPVERDLFLLNDELQDNGAECRVPF